MSRVEHHIRELAPQGVQITIWPCAAGFQANVNIRATSGWACATHSDPVLALAEALRQRLAGLGYSVAARQEPLQTDIEDAIAAADDFEGLLG